MAGCDSGNDRLFGFVKRGLEATTTQTMIHEYTFQFSLPNGLHARPASRLADVAAGFVSDIRLINERTGSDANAKSVLSIVANDVRLGDDCRIHISGTDAEVALVDIRNFTTHILPTCDEPLREPAAEDERVIPRMLLKANVPWHTGTTVCDGIGQGVVVVAGRSSLSAEQECGVAYSCDEEQGKARRAIADVQDGLKGKLAARPSSTEAGVLRAHLSIAADTTLEAKITESTAAGSSAACAIVKAGEFFAARLRVSESLYIRERAIDVEDICQQMLECLYDGKSLAIGIELTKPSVVLAKNLTPRQFLALDKRLLKALILEHAGTTSHTVILARSFGIPTLTGVTDLTAHVSVGREAIVDANLGIVIIEINDQVRRYYERESRRLAGLRNRLATHIHSSAITRDGQRLEVAANVATTDELSPAFEHGAEGIGLFRTEMLFMGRDEAPSEQEQFAVYSHAAQAAAGRPVIIRTVDIGGDKPLPYLQMGGESNPFLGYRGVRIYAEYQDMIANQLRAIVRASAFGTVRTMVPMVCSLEEVRWFKSRIAEVQAELTASGVAFDPSMQIGIMVEVPSAAFILDQLCAEVSFCSIGTNDLMQYFLAVDRDNEKVADLYNARHPAFLRLLAKIVNDARRQGCWVGMCGEMARNEQNLPLLIGLGLDEISVAVPDVLTLKAAITQLSASDCREVLAAALNCEDISAVDTVLASSKVRGDVQSLIGPELIQVDSESQSREEVIKEIADALCVSHRTNDALTVEEAFWAREDVQSTNLGNGFAIPHCKTDQLFANSVGMVRLAKPIKWNDDDPPVQCVILLAIRKSDKDGTHMKVFSTLARKLMNEEFRSHLLDASDRDAIHAFLMNELGLHP